MHVLWFIPSFGDAARLGDPSTRVPPSLSHLSKVARAAEDAGFEGALVPTGEGCHDAWVVASTLAQATSTLRFLVAFRPGFVLPPVAARMASTLDRMSGGRLWLNVVTGGHPHELEKDGDVGVDHDARYRRTDEFLEVVLRSWHEHGWDHDGEFFSVRGGGIAQQPKQRPHPRIYLGGSWRRLVGPIDPSYGEKLRSHSDRTDSEGQRRQNELWAASGGDWLTDVLWNGFARARMGASVALVGSGPTIKAALDEYVDAGIDTFILSGYRHDEEAERVGRHLLPLV